MLHISNEYKKFACGFFVKIYEYKKFTPMGGTTFPPYPPSFFLDTDWSKIRGIQKFLKKCVDFS